MVFSFFYFQDGVDPSEQTRRPLYLVKKVIEYQTMFDINHDIKRLQNPETQEGVVDCM